ncbi:MAG: DUF937 domain-containing protein [Lautropia sp.]|nr:DUF937 domain-containing protein [Lautropia sp.]
MTEPTLTQQLFTQLQGAPMQQIAQQLGTTPEQASTAVSQALPMLMGALGNQASQPQGMQPLLGGLGGPGGANLAGMLGGLLGGSATASGGLAGALGSLLGGAGTSAAGGGLAGALGGMLGGMLGNGGPGSPDTRMTGTAGSAADQTADTGAIDAALGSLFGGQQARVEAGLGQASGLGAGGAHNLLAMLMPIVLSFLGQRFLQGSQSQSDPQALNEALSQEQAELKRQGADTVFSSLLDQNGDGKLDMNDLVSLGSSLLSGRR